jgi:peptidoglycan/xylan/chitin deacetylase (PgdA/CDA1 family)
MSQRQTDAAGVPDRLVLGYHFVSSLRPSKLAVTASQLRRQLASLVARGYEAVTFHEMSTRSAARRIVAPTFDDGEFCVLDRGLPVLEELGLVATMFVPVARVGTPNHVSWDDISLLSSRGWEIGSHTVTHARLTELDDKALDDELRCSREAIEERLGLPCRSIAYPYGAVDRRVRDAAARAGFTAGCVTDGRLRGTDPLRWSRVGIDGRDPHVVFLAKTSAAGRAVRASALGRGLNAVGRSARSLRRLRE